jgi:5-methylthioadenosine/S-adenosylhomocysteine deaminase
MQRRGLLVGLGSDGAAANNSLDLFTELRVAALLAKTLNCDPTALDAFDALELATLGGARVLGMDTFIGSIEPGKSADVIAIDLTHVAALPIHRPESTLLYGASGSHVRHAWIAGRHVLDEGRLTTMDEMDIVCRAAAWSERLAASAAGGH